ncbi:MAG: GNAT family N-acetyltransferase [Deltaproteobacteria bacterium]|nr:GNAT family N-acetyltransferase [Deltaproteobacteria bacterium]
MHKSYVSELEECERLWHRLIRPKSISDLWEFRLSFQRYYDHRPCFLLLEDREGIAGMVPLSYIENGDLFVFFPGELWKGKTWIERTPIYVREPSLVSEVLSSCPDRTYLRYMDISEELDVSGLSVDEIGYVLYPRDLDPDLTGYRARFSNKKLKAILKEVRSYTENASFHLNRVEDFDRIVDMSVKYYGKDSYLHDDRFREGFRDIMYFLQQGGWLRMVSLEIQGETVAVDLGALWQGTYTVFLGGADRGFPGVAKAMNMHHIDFACEKGISKVDFLCGDFHWKKLWHLDPEPLFKFVGPALRVEDQPREEERTIPKDWEKEAPLFV